MSSMIEGSDDGAREDELDLGQEELAPTPKAAVNNPVVAGPGSAHLLDEDGPSVNGSQDHDGPEQDLEDAPSLRDTPPVDSPADTGSIPDDSPSVQGSVRSSQSSSAFPLRGSPASRLSPSPSHRPFDLRFQSRLSSSSFSSLRPQQHSRQSSVASQLFSGTADIETPPGPWEVVRWTKLKKLNGQAFSETGKRNFGRPTCIAVTTTIVVGTSKGTILVFDYQQNLKTIIGPGTKAVETGAITSLAISADHTTIAGGHATGHIFTWEISRSARPFLHIPPTPLQAEARKSDSHVTGVSVVHVGFLGTRRTALVSADDRGMAFSHLATRGMGAVARTVKTTRILGRYPELIVQYNRPKKPSSVLAFAPLPLGNVEQRTDPLGLVAMMTPYLLVIVSTTPVAQTQHKATRPKEVTAHGAMTAALAWFPAIKLKAKDSEVSQTKLVYCWSNILTVLEVSEIEPSEPANGEGPPSLQFRPRSRWRAQEAIVAVQWLSRSVLAVLTITQQLLIIEDVSMRVTESFDLLHKHIYHIDLFSQQLHSLVEQLNDDDSSMHGVVADAFYMSFRAYKGRLFLLGFNDLSVGSLSNWADRLLALMEAGDFIAAIRLATSYYKGDAEKLTVGLPEEDRPRQLMVQEKLLEMISASLKYAFGRNQEASTERLEQSQLEELADASVAACVCMGDLEFMFDEVYSWYDEHDSQGAFLDVLEPYIVQGDVRSLPPTALKPLITHYATNHTASRLEEIICLLDTTTMDIDQVTSLCKQLNLYDAFIYVWNKALCDYVGPLIQLLELVPPTQQTVVNGNGISYESNYINALKMFPYLSYIFTSRVYPTGEDMSEPESTVAKGDLYNFLFSGSTTTTHAKQGDHASFESLRAILKFNTPSFMSMLNEAFEDSFLNETADGHLGGGIKEESDNGLTPGVSVNRQYLISILLQVMNAADFGSVDTIYLDIFIARNLPKYPQYILLSGTTLHQVLVRLCQYPGDEMAEDCQLSVEYLLSMYHPPDIQSLIPLFKEAKFYRILKLTFKGEKLFPELVLTYFDDPEDQESIFSCIRDCLRPSSPLSKKQRGDVVAILQSNARRLTSIDVRKTAQTIQELVPELHDSFVSAVEPDPYEQYLYLKALIEPDQRQAKGTDLTPKLDTRFVERYVQLMCQYSPSDVADFVDVLKVGDLRLDEVLPSMEGSGIVDAAVILLARQGRVRSAMDRLVKHLGALEAGLTGILQSADVSPDSAGTAEATSDLLKSLNKYVKVGIWLCQGQTKTAKWSRMAGKLGKRGSAVFQQPLSFEENLWLDLIQTVVRIARNLSPLLQGEVQISAGAARVTTGHGQLTASFRALIQEVFTALLTSTAKAGDGPAERTDVSFLRILRAFLSHAAASSPSLNELRSVIASIFSAYTYEESLLSLANGMLDKDLFVHVDEVSKLRQRGWRARGQACGACGRRLWGPGAGAQVWEQWNDKMIANAERQERRRSLESGIASRGKGKGTADEPVRHDHDTPDQTRENSDNGPDAAEDVGPLVVFACRHIYHRKCLERAPSTQPVGPEEDAQFSAVVSHHGSGHPELRCLVCSEPRSTAR